MASINKIDLSSITGTSTDIYDIDATTLDGNSLSDLALLERENNCELFQLTCSQLQLSSDEISIEAPYAEIYLCDSEITLNVGRTAILAVTESEALMCADNKVEIYSNRDNALLEITPTDIRIYNKAFSPDDPVRLLYRGGDLDELTIYSETSFPEQPIYYGPSHTQLDHRYVRYGRLPWSEFITTYITDTNSCNYNKVEVEINTILWGQKILDGVDSYWISLDEFRDSVLFFRAALLDQKWLGAGLDGYTVSGLRLEFSGSYIKAFITYSDTSEESSHSVFTPSSTSDQYIYYRVYDQANYPLARDEEWSMSF